MKNWKKTFAIIWTGQFMSLLSSSIVGYAVIFWLSIETGSAEVLAWAGIAALLPQSLLGLVTGVYVDRWDRKRTMILADSFIALCTFALATLFWLDMAEIWNIYILLACRSVGSAFHSPAMQASVPLLAPENQLVRVAGINQVISSMCNIVAPALGALLIGLINMGNILMLDVVGAAIACIALLFVTIPNPQKEANQTSHFMREIKESIHAVRAKSHMGWLFFFCLAANFFIMPIVVLFPLLTLQHFGGDAFDMSIIEICWGGGALLGGALISLKNYKINKVILINLMYIGIGLYFMLTGLLSSGDFVLFSILTVLGGCAGAIYNSSFIAVIQTHINPSVLGRVLSAFFSLCMLPAIIGLLGTGFIADNIGITTAFAVLGVMCIVIGICSFLPKDMTKLGRLNV